MRRTARKKSEVMVWRDLNLTLFGKHSASRRSLYLLNHRL